MIPADDQHEDDRNHRGDGGHGKRGHHGALQHAAGDGVEHHGAEAQGQHDDAVVGAGVLGAEEVGGDGRVGGGGAAVGKGDQGDDGKVDIAGDEAHEDGARQGHQGQHVDGGGAADLVGYSGHNEAAGGVGDAGHGHAGGGQGGGQAPLHAQVIDQGDRQIPGAVDEEDGQEDAPEGDGLHGLAQGVVLHAGSCCGGKVEAVQISPVRQGDEQAGDNAHHKEHAAQDEEHRLEIHQAGGGIGEHVHELAGHRGEHHGGQAEGGHRQAGGKAPPVGQPLLDAGDAGAIGKAGAQPAHDAVGQVQQADGLAVQQAGGGHAGGKQDYAGDAGELGPLPVVEEPADQVAEHKGEQHVGGHHLGRAGRPAEGLHHRGAEHAPQVDDAHAELDHETADNGHPGRLTIAQS